MQETAVTGQAQSSQRLLLWLGLFLLLLLIPLLLREDTPSPASSNQEALHFSLPSGVYQSDQLLSLTTDAPSSSILFTLDGSEPIASSPVYQQPIYLNSGRSGVVVVRARAQLANGRLGAVVSHSYFLNIDTTLPLLSLIIEPAALWNEDAGIYANPLEHGVAWERPVEAVYVAERQQLSFQMAAGLRVHGQFSRSYEKKSLRLYFREEYGEARLNRPLFGVDQLASFKRLIIHAGGQDSPQLPTNWTLMRNQLVARLAEKTAALGTRSQPVLLFINGEPWGVYYLRERIDNFLLSEKFGAETAVLVNTPARRHEDPDPNHSGYRYWDRLTTYAATHDLSDPAAYRYVATQIDLANFVDYSLLQIYSANFDWPITNIHQFKTTTQGGRWQWVLWDSDLSFGLKPWSDLGQNTLAQAVDPNYTAGLPETVNPHDTILLRGLLQNDAFRQRFGERAEELLATTLATEHVIQEIDLLAAELRPAIPFETARWGSSPEAWEGHVEQLREFARQRPQIMQQFLQEELAP